MSRNGHRPKLLFLAPGSWVHGQRALRAALMADFDTVFVDSYDPGMRDTQGYRFVKLPRSGYSLYRKVLPSSAATQIKDSFLFWWFKNLWQQVAPDLVHVCWIDYRAAFCSRAGMTPLILSCWGSDISFQTGPQVDHEWRMFVKEALAGAALTIVDGPGMAACCEMLTGRHVPSEMLHLGVDTDRFCGGLTSERRSMRARLGIAHDAVLLSSMRAMSGLYNHELILQAFAQAIPKFRRPAYLLFKSYNAHLGFFEQLQQKAQELGIRDRVKFVDRLAEAQLPALYAATDIVINFPQFDSFPVTLLEAGACECAVICSSLESYIGVLPDDNITWVPANDPAELAAAVAEETNASKRPLSFPKVREAIIECFSEKRYQQRLAHIYRSLI